MVGITYVYINTILEFYGYIDLSNGVFTFVWVFFFYFHSSLLLSWMFEHDCLDTCCFGCLICMHFSFMSLYCATECVSHGKALKKYNYYYYILAESRPQLPYT